MPRKPDTIRLVLRLPAPLHRRLTREAARNGRSLNSEMIERLDNSFGYVVRVTGKRYRRRGLKRRAAVAP